MRSRITPIPQLCSRIRGFFVAVSGKCDFWRASIGPEFCPVSNSGWTRKKGYLTGASKPDRPDFAHRWRLQKRQNDSLSELAQARAKIDGFLLEGGLDPADDFDADDSNRERVFSQK